MVITSSSNKIVKDILDIKRKGKKSSSQLLFFEGQRLVEDVLACGAEIETLIIRESSSEKYSHICTNNKVIFSDKLFEHISGTVNSQGIALLAKRPILPIGGGKLFLALDRVQDPGNLGTIIRTALACDVDGIFLLKGTVDLYNEKALRSTMGAIYKIPIYIDVEMDHLVNFIKEQGITPIKASIKGEQLYDKIPKGKYMVFVGNEGNGLSQEVEELEGLDVRIPLYGDIESLNVAVATGIILYGIKGNE
ncbi:RNA methyltransferase [Alkalicella caledoniensis]|uniref:RNA methyltransferase n=1 Tax=Alkalicella caledoniensis TaxID=2731377 RepID=A0A7G9WAJ0_ALKCA|nr:RNA methyltransferase [Alkalicella caledoniensis]QNO15702.1 RNA methyltransferase [Alkalicella caledoniensis]